MPGRSDILTGEVAAPRYGRLTFDLGGIKLRNKAPSYSEPAPFMPQRPAWQARAICHDEPVETFFPASGSIPAETLAMCLRCPVVVECREHAIEHHERGIWGGTTEKERERMRRARRRNAQLRGLR